MPGPNELDASLSALAEGQRVFGRYTLGRVLGRGTIGVVWLARDEEQRRNVELKFLPELLARDVVAVSDLRTEVERVRGLKHEAFQAIHDFHEGEGRAAVSSEFVPGNTLGALCEVRLNGCFDAAELLPWTEPLAEAFTQAHEQLHLVHRALHPGHLVLTPAGRVKVLDFGIAHTLLEAAARHSSDARSSAALTFSSPQLAAGALPGPADDIYALGATLYDLLAGAPPVFDSSTPRLPIAERRAVLNRWGAAIPPVWETAIAACLAHDPALRPASVAALIKTLREGFVAGPAAESVLLKIAAPKTGAEGAAAGASQPSAPTAPAPPSTKPSQPVAGAEPAAPVVSEVKAPARTTAPATPAAPIAMTLPEVEAANAITVQRAHHRGALVALICVGLAVWIARLVADRMLPPVLPEMKTPPHSVATAAPNSTATPATPVPLLADAAPPTRPPPEITPPVAPPVATPAPATPTPATPPPPPPATPMPTTPAPATPVPTTPPPPPPAATPVPKPATPVPATPMPATPAPATPMPATPAPQPPPTTPAPKLATPMPATPPPATPIPATPPPPPPSATPAPNTPAAGPRRVEPVPSLEPPKAGEPWTNSLGMPFVPVPKLPVLVAIWETRSRDFATFAKAIALHWKPAKDGPDYPATDVSFLDAMLFCEWLTTAEEDAGRLKPGQHYRLPTDAEWSAAAGLAPERGESLRERDDSSDKSFPWGSAWPPPPTAGNFRGLNPAGAGDPGGPTGDTFARTAPVGSFPPNRLGLFDMAGNVAEMVSDLIAPELGLHATRGGSYLDGDRRTLRTRARGIGEDDHGHAPQIGFRVVLDPGKTN